MDRIKITESYLEKSPQGDYSLIHVGEDGNEYAGTVHVHDGYEDVYYIKLAK